MPANSYNISPTPQAGNGAYGRVPGNVQIPPNLYQGIRSIYPGINGLTSGAGNVISHEINGELSPQTINTIQDEAASFGVSNGLPQTQFSGYRGLRNLGLNVEQQQRQGVQDYNSLLGNLSHVVTDPHLAADIASSNAINNSAPDPQAAAMAQLAAFRQAMQEMQRLTGGGGGGGTGGPQGGSPFNTRSFLQSPGTVVGNSTATGVTGGISDAGLDRWNNWANNLNTHQTSDEDLFNIFGIDDPGAYEYAEGTPGGGYDWETMLEDYGLE